MAASTELMEFVRDALARGTPRARIEEMLVNAGWGRDMVNDALAAFADVDFPVPVPRPRAYLSAREAFAYLLLFGTLYVTAFNVGALVFEGINRAFPDPAAPPNAPYVREQLRWAVSAVLVAFPVFFFLSLAVERAVRLNPVKRRSHVRRTLMYSTVLLAAAVLIGDVMTLVYNALGGELTARFALKVLTVAAIAGGILIYLLLDVRLADTSRPLRPSRPRRAPAIASLVTVGAVVIMGLFLIGPPALERARRLDARRTQDLQRLSEAANVYFHRQRHLPSSMTELASGERGVTMVTGDGTGAPYEYRATGDRTYELCATFDRDSSEDGRQAPVDFWSHGTGRQCFQLQVKAID
jgi:hypothetical protein